MAFTASAPGLLERVEKFVAAHLDDRWVAEPKPARLALLVREELRRWTLSTYPGASCDGAALRPDSRRRLSLTIHSAPVSHRVEVWGLGDVYPPQALGRHTPHSWVVLAGDHASRHTPYRSVSEQLRGGRTQAGGEPQRDRILPEPLDGGDSAPDGCPECLGK